MKYVPNHRFLALTKPNPIRPKQLQQGYQNRSITDELNNNDDLNVILSQEEDLFIKKNGIRSKSTMMNYSGARGQYAYNSNFL